MSAHMAPLPARVPSPSRPQLQIVKPATASRSLYGLRAAFWLLGLAAAALQAWGYRFLTSADSIAYLDMSDGVMPGGDWHRLINGTWSPLYAVLIGTFRRAFGIKAANEIVALHLLNVAFFAAAFVCFEIFLAMLLRKTRQLTVAQGTGFPVPQWAIVSLAYTIFLWGSIAEIRLDFLRPDLLMSCFLYLVAAMLVSLSGRPARWRDYLLLGIVLGVAYLAKTPMLPIGLLVLAMSVIVVTNRRSALKMAVAAGAITLAIGSLYFVPLSRERGKLTFGESGTYNYLIHVDRKSLPSWYPVNSANGGVVLKHPATQIFPSPAVFAFSTGPFATYPLRFEPSWWLAGIKPGFSLSRQLGATYANYIELRRTARPLVPLITGLVLLAFFVSRNRAWLTTRSVWPVALLGLAGFAMYLLVHVEARYTGAFFVLFLCAALSLFLEVQHRMTRLVIAVITPVIIVLLLFPLATRTYATYRESAHSLDQDSFAANQLATLGVRPGDRVGRISSILTDFGIERVARVEIATEVDFTHTSEFWSAPREIQNQVLQVMAGYGAKAVIATQPQLNRANQADWIHLGATDYWAWIPSASKAR